MIGAIAGVGRVAISNALRQVARQFGQEAMERIMAGEAIESVLTREQTRELAKKLGK
jgi:Spy/CpxP family protein refolding chaperone